MNSTTSCDSEKGPSLADILAFDPNGTLSLGEMSAEQKKIVEPRTEATKRLCQLWSWYLAKGDYQSKAVLDALKDAGLNAVDWGEFIDAGKGNPSRVKPGAWKKPQTEAEKAVADVQEWGHVDEISAELVGDLDFPEDAISELIIPPGTMLRETMEFIEANEVRPQPLFRVSGALAYASNMFGRKIRTECGLRTNLNLLNIGKTACGKDAAVGCLDNSRLHWESKNGEEDCRVDNGSQGDAGLGRSLAKCPVLLSIVDEAGIEITEMLAGEGQAHKGRLTGVFLKLATMKGKRFRLPKYADESRDIEVAEPCWTFFGVTNEATIAKALTGANIASGFLPRCLVIWSKDFPDKLDMRETDPSQALIILSKSWRAWFPNGQTMEQWREMPSPVRFFFTKDAKVVLKNMEAKWAKMMTSDSPFAALYTRAEEQAKKIALILAANLIKDPAELDQGGPRPIDALLTGAACDIVDWSVRSGCRLIEQFAENSPQGALIRAVLTSFTKLAAKARSDKNQPKPGVPAWMVKKNFDHVEGWRFNSAVDQLCQTRRLADVTPQGRKGKLLCPVSLLVQSPAETPKVA